MRLPLLIVTSTAALLVAGCGGSKTQKPPASGAPGSSSGASVPAVPSPADTLRALKVLPQNRFPATLARGPNAEHAAITVTLPAPYPGTKVTSTLRSAGTGPIGTLTRAGNQIVVHCRGMAYSIAPFRLPTGVVLPAQRLTLDPHATSTLSFNLATGQITRDLHYVMGAGNLTYNGRPELPLSDHAQSGVLGVRRLSANTYEIRVLILWHTQLALSGVSMNGTTIPLSGNASAQATEYGRYLVTFPAA